MNCQEFQDHLSEFTDGTLGPAERQAFCAHRDSCEACREELSLFESALSAVDSAWPDLEPSPTFVAQVWERIRQEPAPKPGWREVLAGFFRPQVTLALASMVVVLALVGYPALRDYNQGQQIVDVAYSEVLPETRLTEVDMLPAVPDPELLALVEEVEVTLPDLSGLGEPSHEENELDWLERL